MIIHVFKKTYLTSFYLQISRKTAERIDNVIIGTSSSQYYTSQFGVNVVDNFGPGRFPWKHRSDRCVHTKSILTNVYTSVHRCPCDY